MEIPPHYRAITFAARYAVRHEVACNTTGLGHDTERAGEYVVTGLKRAKTTVVMVRADVTS